MVSSPLVATAARAHTAYERDQSQGVGQHHRPIDTTPRRLMSFSLRICVSMESNRTRVDSTLLPLHREPSMSFKKPPYPSECDKLSPSRSPKTALSLSLTRRGFLARSIAALSVSPYVSASDSATAMTTSDADAVCRRGTRFAPSGRGGFDPPLHRRPRTQATLDELRRRIAATQWPEKETVTDQSQGVQLATMQELARYWATDYDWRKVRGETERAAAIHHRDRRARHPFHSRSFEA